MEGFSNGLRHSGFRVWGVEVEDPLTVLRNEIQLLKPSVTVLDLQLQGTVTTEQLVLV